MQFLRLEFEKILTSILTYVVVAVLGMAHVETQASVFEAGVLPGVAIRRQAQAVLRVNARLLVGGELLSLGVFGDFESLMPQVIDSAFGLAIRIGHEMYVEAQAGPFQRSFRQPGTPNLSGKGQAANLLFGVHLSPHLGVEIMVSGKRITSGTLDRRLIVDVLPLISTRADF